MTEQQCKDLYRQVFESRIETFQAFPYDVVGAEADVLRSMLALETSLIMLLASMKEPFFRGAI